MNMFSSFNVKNVSITREDINSITGFNPINVLFDAYRIFKSFKQKCLSFKIIGFPIFSIVLNSSFHENGNV